jgi:phosphate starvation-inducible PhoH-like protein|tara:strand:- start:2580 stop:3584 length:1005 start_codon:yes stop_codon:yes gene_type:complete
MSILENSEQHYSLKRVDKETINIKVFSNDILLAVLGEFNKNARELENLTKTKIYFRGNSITVKGEKENILKVSSAIKFLISKYIKTNIIENQDIRQSVKKNDYSDRKDNIHNLDQLIKTPKKSVIARSKKQSEYIKALKENDITIALGPAGTGKSFLAVSVAITMLMEKKVERVILSRPAVEAGEKLGFLPGDMKEKVDPYLRPLYDALYDLFGYEKINKKIESGEIEIAPLAFMRGRTLKNSFAILDEAQNATTTQIKMFLTRIGENSKLVVNGDPSQVDLINKSQSGLVQTKKILSKIKEIKIIEFDHKDVVRHPLVTKIIQAFKKKFDDKN